MATGCAGVHCALEIEALSAGNLDKSPISPIDTSSGTNETLEAGVFIGPYDDSATIALSLGAGIDEHIGHHTIRSSIGYGQVGALIIATYQDIAPRLAAGKNAGIRQQGNVIT